MTDLTFNRPNDFSAREFVSGLGRHEHRDAEIELVNVRLKGGSDILDPICNQWFLQHGLVERSEGEARFLLDTDTMMTYMPYLLLFFDKLVQVAEPAALREHLSELAHELADHHNAGLP